MYVEQRGIKPADGMFHGVREMSSNEETIIDCLQRGQDVCMKKNKDIFFGPALRWMLGPEDTTFVGYTATQAEEAYIRSLYQEISRKLRHVRLNPRKLNQGGRTDSTDECCGVVELWSLIGLKDLNAPPQSTKPRYLGLHKNYIPQSSPQ